VEPSIGLVLGLKVECEAEGEGNAWGCGEDFGYFVH
jgi:hypothetical protein